MTEGGARSLIFPKQGRRAVVLCDGPRPPFSLIGYWLDGSDLFVCADGAGYPYDDLPRTPDTVIGDFDSLSGRILSGRAGPRYLVSPEQNSTDSEKALEYCIRNDCREVVLLGALGWLIDHTLYNVSLVERFADRLRICLSGPHDSSVRIGPGETTHWNFAPGTIFSLSPLTGTTKGVSISGCAYDLRENDLGAHGPSSVSNKVTEPPLFIEVTTGSLLLTVRHEKTAESAAEFP